MKNKEVKKIFDEELLRKNEELWERNRKNMAKVSIWCLTFALIGLFLLAIGIGIENEALKCFALGMTLTSDFLSIVPRCF